ncbi:MAG TPA: transglycosylase domain-containing protein [Vicinamibacteria bacterium]|nr:transglycosylase domain-containing protein [Vicinamibacteria bacterium]
MRFTAWTCRLSQGPAGRIARSAIALSVGLAALAAAGLYETVFLDPFGLPDLDTFLASAPRTIGEVEDARGEVLAQLAREYRRPIEEHSLPPVLRAALLAAEDKDFFEHQGIDLQAWPRVLAKAVGASWGAHRLALPQGGSTLTQQLVRVAFLNDWWTRENGDTLLVDTVPNRALASLVGVRATNKARRKLEEIRLALWLEDALARRLGSRRRAKEEILRRYAMYVYLGDGRYGFAAASEHYLGRPMESLRDDEADLAAVLAGIVKSPAAYSPSEANRERVLRRRNQILHLMEREGFLSSAERARLEWAPVPVRATDEPSVRPEAATVVSYVLESLSHLGDPTLTTSAVFDGHIRVQSTVDARLQRLVAEALESGLRAYEARHPGEPARVQGSAVVMANSDARILALVGGRVDAGGGATHLRDFNRVTSSYRQAGSTMKPLVYLAALRQGLTLDSTVVDEPVWLPLGGGRAKRISNYDGVFKGRVSLRRALAESRNAATMRLAEMVGVPTIVTTAHELGIKSALAPYLTTALGASDVNLLELANVYRTFASGRRAEPWIVRAVLARDGLVLYERPEAKLRPLDDPALPLIQEALRGNVRLPGATGHSLASLPFAVMGKTGTTNDFRDALYVGSTFGPGGITMAVRIGFDDNRTLGERETGGRTALPVFRQAVSRAYANGVLGAPPVFPEAIEHGIDAYLLACASREAAQPGETPPGEPPQPAPAATTVSFSPEPAASLGGGALAPARMENPPSSEAPLLVSPRLLAPPADGVKTPALPSGTSVPATHSSG